MAICELDFIALLDGLRNLVQLPVLLQPDSLRTSNEGGTSSSTRLVPLLLLKSFKNPVSSHPVNPVQCTQSLT